jgi:hypothetical protein
VRINDKHGSSVMYGSNAGGNRDAMIILAVALAAILLPPLLIQLGAAALVL